MSGNSHLWLMHFAMWQTPQMNGRQRRAQKKLQVTFADKFCTIQSSRLNKLHDQ